MSGSVVFFVHFVLFQQIVGKGNSVALIFHLYWKYGRLTWILRLPAALIQRCFIDCYRRVGRLFISYLSSSYCRAAQVQTAMPVHAGFSNSHLEDLRGLIEVTCHFR